MFSFFFDLLPSWPVDNFSAVLNHNSFFSCQTSIVASLHCLAVCYYQGPKPQNKDLSLKNGLYFGVGTHLKSDLQSISGDLQDSGFRKLPRNTHPRVGCEHGAPQLLTGNNHHMVGDHWETEVRKKITYKNTNAWTRLTVVWH